METTQVKADLPVEGKAKKKRLRMPKGKKGKWLKRLLILAGVLLVIWWFFLRPMQSAGQQLMAGMYLPAPVQMQDLTVSVSGSGTVKPIDSYKVGALVTGEVLEAPFEEGDHVEKGDLLYRVDAGSAEISLQEAQLALSNAQTAYNNLVSNQRPAAGTGGVVQKVYVQKGDLVSAGSPVADVADTSVMTLTLPFQSADAGKLSVGQSATVTLAGTMETLTGTVTSISSAELVGAGGALVRQVKLKVSNPGALTTSTTATATVGDVACAGSAAFEENSRQTVTAQTSGEVTQVLVTAGSRVSAGDALIVLGGSAAEATAQNAASSLESARLSLQRTQDALDNYTITAPISGTVIEKNFKAGDKIETESLSAAGGSLAVLYDMSALTFVMNIHELDVSRIAVGQRVEVTSSAVAGQTFTGTVDKININGTTVNGKTTYPVTVQLDGAQALWPGMNVSAKIVVEEAGRVLCVPADYVDRGDTVLVALPGCLDASGVVVDITKIETRAVTLGRGSDEYVEILDGLEEGETVLVMNTASDAMAALMGG